MMKVKLYAIFDVDSGVYDGPFRQISDNVAMRNFGDMCMNEDGPIGQHPECFTLFKIGYFDDSKGQLIHNTPYKLIAGLEAVAKAREIVPGQLDAFDKSDEVVKLDEEIG